MTRRRTVDRVQALMDAKVDLGRLDPPGTYDDLHHKLARQLAYAMHCAESDDVAVSWSAQERAQAFFNAHGFEATLDELLRLEALRRESARA